MDSSRWCLAAALLLACAFSAAAAPAIKDVQYTLERPRHPTDQHPAPFPHRMRMMEVAQPAPGVLCGGQFACSANSLCIDNKCDCDPGFSGANCTTELVCNGKGEMVNGTCTCSDGWSGPSCLIGPCPKDCSGNGLCMYDTRNRPSCLCMYGTRGKDCSEGGCPNNCSSHGDCVILKGGEGDEVVALCKCHAGWRNQDCSLAGCPICVHGSCVDDKCQCEAGYWKDDCSERTCPGNCTGHGQCNDGTCSCDKEWAGEACDVPIEKCPDRCSGRGKCTADGCQCQTGFGGVKCERECPNMCNGRGRCDNGTCYCNAGWAAPGCATRSCKMNCTSPEHGTCEDGTCACMVGWTGEVCDVKLCKNGCSDQGWCRNGTCKCFGPISPAKAERLKRWQFGYEGDDCSLKRCKNNCTSEARGSCNGTSGLCQCTEGFVGADCNRTKCDLSCNGKGVCPDKETGCQCDWGWKGPNCETPYCVNNCSFVLGQGFCVQATQTCQCQPKYSGHDCSQLRCPTNIPKTSDLRFVPVEFPGNVTIDGADADPDPLACSRSGWCVKGKCACFPGTKGEACEWKQCPMTKGIECSKHGICNGTSGECACEPGWDGPACAASVSITGNDCPMNCSGRGICKNGTCYCEHGKFFGEGCEKVRIACPDGCDRNGKCDPETGKCKCNMGRTGEDCMTQICYPSANCSGKGECRASDGVFGVCECVPPFTGDDCVDVKCDDPCSGRGQCLNDECFCEPGFTGNKCQEELCPRNCTGKGTCQPHGCECQLGWSGRACNVQTVTCPGSNIRKGIVCHGHGKCDIIADPAVAYGAYGNCTCDAGWNGTDCGQAFCPKGCNEINKQGRCIAPGVCQCAPTHYGDQCEIERCPKSCSDRGSCVNNKCQCQAGWGGEACDIRLRCEPACGPKGTCFGNVCKCEKGWLGATCEQEWCPQNCSERGRCVNGTCRCIPGFGGANCGILADENMCTAWCQSKCDGIIGVKQGPNGEQITAKSCVDECISSKCSQAVKGVNTGLTAQGSATVATAPSTTTLGETQPRTPFSFLELESELDNERVLTKGHHRRKKTWMPRFKRAPAGMVEMDAYSTADLAGLQRKLAVLDAEADASRLASNDQDL